MSLIWQGHLIHRLAIQCSTHQRTKHSRSDSRSKLMIIHIALCACVINILYKVQECQTIIRCSFSLLISGDWVSRAKDFDLTLKITEEACQLLVYLLPTNAALQTTDLANVTERQKLSRQCKCDDFHWQLCIGNCLHVSAWQKCIHEWLINHIMTLLIILFVIFIFVLIFIIATTFPLGPCTTIQLSNTSRGEDNKFPALSLSD